MKNKMIFAMCVLVLISLFAGCADFGPEAENFESGPTESNIFESANPNESKIAVDTDNENVITEVIGGENLISTDIDSKPSSASDIPQNAKDIKEETPAVKKSKENETSKEKVNREENPSSKPTPASKPKPAATPELTPIPAATAEPTPQPTQTLKGNAKAISGDFCKSVFNEINELRINQGYSAAQWDGGLKGKAQGWADSLIEQSIKKNKYTHYHDDNRDSSEGIFWFTNGKTSAESIAKQVSAHCPACISSTEVIGIGGTMWENCPIGDDMGFIVVRFYS